MLAAEKYRGSTRSLSMKPPGMPVRFSTSRRIMSCPAENELQDFTELIRNPSASYSRT